MTDTARDAFELIKANSDYGKSAYPAELTLTPADAAFVDRFANAAMVDGARLIDDKALLIGVPFLITSVTFRDGNIRTEKIDGKKVETPSNYASVEATIGAHHMLMRAVTRKLIDRKVFTLFDPLEHVVFNDGSSGICRSLVQYCVARGLFTVTDKLPESGESGSTRYDIYRADWGSPTGEPMFGPDDDPRFNFDLACPRGLRVSEYDGPNGPAGTYYLG